MSWTLCSSPPPPSPLHAWKHIGHKASQAVGCSARRVHISLHQTACRGRCSMAKTSHRFAPLLPTGLNWATGDWWLPVGECWHGAAQPTHRVLLLFATRLGANGWSNTAHARQRRAVCSSGIVLVTGAQQGGSLLACLDSTRQHFNYRT